jgi:hypothetical protein
MLLDVIERMLLLEPRNMKPRGPSSDQLSSGFSMNIARTIVITMTIDFGTLIWPHFGRLILPHLIYSDRSSYPVPASRDGEGDGQETQGGTV